MRFLTITPFLVSVMGSLQTSGPTYDSLTKLSRESRMLACRYYREHRVPVQACGELEGSQYITDQERHLGDLLISSVPADIKRRGDVNSLIPAFFDDFFKKLSPYDILGMYLAFDRFQLGDPNRWEVKLLVAAGKEASQYILPLIQGFLRSGTQNVSYWHERLSIKTLESIRKIIDFSPSELAEFAEISLANAELIAHSVSPFWLINRFFNITDRFIEGPSEHLILRLIKDNDIEGSVKERMKGLPWYTLAKVKDALQESYGLPDDMSVQNIVNAVADDATYARNVYLRHVHEVSN